jgi:hypothetical protein
MSPTTAPTASTTQSVWRWIAVDLELLLQPQLALAHVGALRYLIGARPGLLELANGLGQQLDARLIIRRMCELLVELERAPHRRLTSTDLRTTSATQRKSRDRLLLSPMGMG